MLFTSPAFLAFFVVCFTVHWSLPQQGLRKLWLLACSYVFYGWWDWRFLGLILAATIVNYLAAIRIVAAADARARRAWMTVSLVASLGILGFFKYYGFFVSSVVEGLSRIGIPSTAPLLEIVLPVGISFFTFQALSYTIDVYRGQLALTRRFSDFALYISFFPQLVAGPIVRARHFLPQLEWKTGFDQVDTRKYLILFLLGFFKKACISDNIAAAIDPVFATPTAFGAADLALAALGYSIQIYCDFSGYSDMAIGVAGLLGYDLMLNFDFPYLSRNVREFWQRWHISLSTWLRDYLYIPLGGSRGGLRLTRRNLMLTMLLGGLWHGAAWTFVAWGALHGAALLVHREWSRRRPAPSDSALPHAVGVALTFSWVVLCFTIFRCESLGVAIDFLTGLTGARPGTEALGFGLRWLLFFASLGVVHFSIHRNRARLTQIARETPATAFSLAYGAACAIALFFTPTNPNPFIYFQF